MNREIFQENLLRATESAVLFARKYVLNDLSDQVVFLVHTNQSCDEKPRRGDEETYPEDTQENDQPLTFTTAEAAVDYLWRNEKVPEWIDINVGGEDGDYTYLRLLCCGRFTATVELLYHRDGNIPPFSVKSPVFSPGYDDTPEAESQKFDVNWQEKAKREFKRLQETENNLGHRLLRTVRSLIGGQ